jgi:proline iminopeptidase
VSDTPAGLDVGDPANTAVQYALGHQRQVNKLVLITPGMRMVGLEPDDETRREIVQLRQDEPWFTEAAASFERTATGEGTEADWSALAPFFYCRWDATAQAHDAAGEKQANEEAAQVFGAEGAFDPAVTRAALAAFGSPVQILAGDLDLQRPPRIVAEFAALFPTAQLVAQPGAGHFPWLDDPGQFVSAVTAFLGQDL